MKLLFATVAALCLAGALARCPNGCSGHGGCFGSDKCTCWANWQGPDCSQRTCAFDIAWATNYWNDAHYYAECSAKGLCDRETGECVCFEGYTGRACKRSVCPNDCSGHGKCRLVEELRAATGNKLNPYTNWDGDKIQACVCDGGFYGPDCSLRYCPKGDDPMTICDGGAHDSTTTDNEQVQTLRIAFASDVVTSATVENDELALKFTDNHNETWWTPRIQNVWTGHSAVSGSGGAAAIEAALTAIPNFKIPSISVADGGSDVSAGAASYVEYEITFDHSRTSGNQVLLEADFNLGCMTKGCQPMYKQIRALVDTSFSPITITDDSVLNAHFPGTGASMDVEVEIVVYENETASGLDDLPFHSYAARFTINGVAVSPQTSLGRIPDGATDKGIGYDHAPIGYGMFVDFGSRTPTVGGYNLEFAVAKATISETTTANPEKEDIECSGRGFCDVSSGNCNCFEGYYGDHCSEQTILV